MPEEKPLVLITDASDGIGKNAGHIRGTFEEKKAKITLHFRPGIVVKKFSKEEIVLAFPHCEVRYAEPSEIQKICLEKLIAGETESGLSLYWETLPEFYYFLDSLHDKSILAYSVGNLATFIPGFGHTVRLQEIKQSRVLLSRFCYLHVEDGKSVLETPLAAVKIILHDPICLRILHALSTEKTLDELKEFDQETLQAFLSILQMGHCLHEEESSLTTWEFHDLLFHARSRQGRHSNPNGATFRFLGEIPPTPAIRPATDNPLLPLFRPTTELSMPFSQVTETRTSIREHGSKPITISELGEFLYHSARVKEILPGKQYEATRRPYPGGGACYELELYPVIYRCEGIESGLYRYHPDSHSLCKCESWNSQIAKLLQDAKDATLKEEYPQILIIIAARFSRVSWKYQSIAYATILKNTGALMHNMYLVATAMNLAPSGVGYGNADSFSTFTKTNYYEESSVGEFILGSKESKW